MRLLAGIDELLVGHRTELGRLLLNGLDQARVVDPGTITWQFRTYRLGKNRPQLGFGVCSIFNEITQAAFRSWVLLRHHERGTLGEDLATLTTIGVLLTPRTDGYRAWDTTTMAVSGDPELTEEELHTSRELWNTPQSRS